MTGLVPSIRSDCAGLPWSTIDGEIWPDMARYDELGQVNRSGSQEYISKAQVSERCDRHECSAPKMGMRNGGTFVCFPQLRHGGVPSRCDSTLFGRCFQNIQKQMSLLSGRTP